MMHIVVQAVMVLVVASAVDAQSFRNTIGCEDNSSNHAEYVAYLKCQRKFLQISIDAYSDSVIRSRAKNKYPANSCTSTVVQNSDKAYTNAVAGTTGVSISVTCDTNYHIAGTTDTSASTKCYIKNRTPTWKNMPQCVADRTCGDTDGSGTDFTCQIAGVQISWDDLPERVQCGADGCTSSDCCI